MLVVICLDIHTVYISPKQYGLLLGVFGFQTWFAPRTLPYFIQASISPVILDHAGSGSSELWGWVCWFVLGMERWRRQNAEPQDEEAEMSAWKVFGIPLRGSSWLRKKFWKGDVVSQQILWRGKVPQFNDGDDSRTLSLYLYGVYDLYGACRQCGKVERVLN